MRLFRPALLGLLPFIFSMTACNSSSGTPASEPVSQRVFLGDLDQKLGSIYSDENEAGLEACDIKQKSKILEIARDLESKRAEIEALAASQPSGDEEVYVTFGKYKFRDLKTPTDQVDAWTTRTFSWANIINFYGKMKDSPIDERWIDLNSSVRGLVPDDEDRIVYGFFKGLRRDSGPAILEIARIAEVCLSDSACTNPLLTSEQSRFLSTNWFYRILLNTFNDPNSSFKLKREYVGRLARRVSANARGYGFQRNAGAKISGDTLVIPMDLRVLGDGAAGFVEYIEKVWSEVDGFKLKIDFAQPRGFILNVSDLVGERAYVNYDKNEMQLYNFGRLKSAAHEFGHVIGVKDKYYSAWNSETCGYDVEQNSKNIMSSTMGSVVPSVVEEIKKEYWKAN